MKTLESIIVQFQAKRAIQTWAKGATIHVDAKAYSLGGQSPYFSVTAMIHTPASRRQNDCDACGCLHGEILKMWPQLAPIVALHLSDAITGEPMHAVANGWYWLSGAMGGAGERYHGGTDKAPEQCLRILADHLRVTVYEAEAMTRCIPANAQGKGVFAKHVDTLRPRWKTEAEAGLALLHELAGNTVAA